MIFLFSYISLGARVPGLFMNYGSQRPVAKILKLIRRGDSRLSLYLEECSTARQCAAALLEYLKVLRKPLLPTRVQELLIGKYRVKYII